MTVLLAITTLLLTPWKGADLPTASPTAVKYQLTIKDAPGAVVHLRATQVANGWLAAFCDNRVCSPSKVHETIPESGTMKLQFELIKQVDGAPHSTGAVIESNSGVSVAVKPPLQ